MALRTPRRGLRAREGVLGEARQAQVVVVATLAALIGAHTTPGVFLNTRTKTLTIHCASKAIANEVFLLRERVAGALAKEGLRGISIIVR